MRTRSQRHEWMQESRRLAAAAAPPAAPTTKKHTREESEAAPTKVAAQSDASPRRSAAPPAAVELLSPPMKRMRALPSAKRAMDSSARAAVVEDVDSEPLVLRRTLHYDEAPSKLKPEETPPAHTNDGDSDGGTELIAVEALNNDSAAVLLRICAGQWLRHAGGVVGRDQQKREIRAVLDGTAADGRNCLFLVGPPGTGKTSSVDELLASYGAHAPSAVRINCSTFANPSALYVDIARRLSCAQDSRNASSSSLPAAFNALALDKFLCQATTDTGSSKRPASCVLVLDEVDHLLRLPRRQQARVAQVLRFLVQWSTLSPSLKFLGIMNGIDMYAQITRVLSVAGQPAVDVPHVVFGSYSHDELVDILRHYVDAAAASSAATNGVDARALELIARKVAARDGDARRAISLLQQCARSALQRATPPPPAVSASSQVPATPTTTKISLRDVMQSSSDMLSTPLAKQIAQLPRLPKLLLYVLTTLAPSNQAVMSDLNAVSEELARLRTGAGAEWLPRFSREELVRHVATLECYALLKRDPRRRAAASSSASFWSAKLGSAATIDDVTRALRGDDVLCQALYLTS